MNLRQAHPEYVKLLARYSHTVQELALATREFILSEAPDASEFVYDVYTIADHFTFTNKPTDAFVFTTTHSNWVNLGFNFGSQLNDPNDLLQGDGKWIRHIRIAQMADLDNHGVRELVRAAIAEAERPGGEAGKPCTVVRKAQSSKTGLNETRSKLKGRGTRHRVSVSRFTGMQLLLDIVPLWSDSNEVQSPPIVLIRTA